MNSRITLSCVVIWVGILSVLAAPATAQPEADGAQKLHKAATDDIKMLLAREQSWIGRPNAVQFTPMAGIASGFIPYDASTVGADLLYYQKNMEELASTRAEGEEGFMLMAGLSATFQWSSWLGHTSRAFRILHLEFLQIQNDLEEEWKEQINNHPDNPVPESFKEELRLQLGQQEQQAFNKLLAARAELAKELRQAKVDLAEGIRDHVLRGDEANLMMAKTIYEIVTLENEWNEPFLMLGNTLMRPKYFQLSEEELKRMQDVRQLDNDAETQTLITSFIDYRSIEPIAPFALVPRTYSVASDKESYDSGDVVTINIQGSHEFNAAVGNSFRLEILDTSTILTEDEIPGAIYEGRGDDPLEVDEREDIGDPEKEYLELPAIFPLEGNNPQVIIKDLPEGEFTALVIEVRDVEHTVVAETEFRVSAPPAIRFVRWTDDGYETLNVLPYYVPIYVIMEFGVEPLAGIRSVVVTAEGVADIMLQLKKVEPLLFRSETPFYLEPDVTDQISIDS